WGGVVPGVGKATSNNTIKFTGQYRDTETNLDYFGARYYANVTGRFMSPDWAGAPTAVPYAEFGDPQSLNLYAYVRNSPIVRVDVNGHFDDPFGTFSGGDTSRSNIQSRFTHLAYNPGGAAAFVLAVPQTPPGQNSTWDWSWVGVGGGGGPQPPDDG